MSGLAGFRAKNHPQQIAKAGVVDQVDDRGTPPELFDPLNERFGFTLDAAAAAHNAKCPTFFTITDDALSQPWGGSVWCNPPYSNLDAWLVKAWDEHFRGVKSIVMLVPANRTEQAWWQDHVEPFRDRPDRRLTVEFLRGRRRFIRHDKGMTEVEPNQRPPFGVCLLIWSRA